MPGLGKSGTSRMSVLRSIRGNARIVTRGRGRVQPPCGEGRFGGAALMQVVQPVIVPIEPLLVDLGYVQQTRDEIHAFTQTLVALFVFHGDLPVLRGK